jgi:hypothetical protein
MEESALATKILRPSTLHNIQSMTTTVIANDQAAKHQ